MKKEYEKPIIEKITFDYKSQVVTSGPCTGSIMNIATSVDQCGEGTKNYIGWNNAHPGNF